MGCQLEIELGVMSACDPKQSSWNTRKKPSVPL